MNNQNKNQQQQQKPLLLPHFYLSMFCVAQRIAIQRALRSHLHLFPRQLPDMMRLGRVRV